MKTFETQFFAGFDDTDLGGVVFFGQYYRIAHKGLEEYIQSLGIAWKDWFQNPNFFVPLVHSEADYLKPLFAGQTYKLKIEVEKVSDSSVTFAYAVLSQDENVCARLKTVHVFVDSNSYQKTAIPSSIRDLLSQS